MDHFLLCHKALVEEGTQQDRRLLPPLPFQLPGTASSSPQAGQPATHHLHVSPAAEASGASAGSFPTCRNSSQHQQQQPSEAAQASVPDTDSAEASRPQALHAISASASALPAELDTAMDIEPAAELAQSLHTSACPPKAPMDIQDQASRSSSVNLGTLAKASADHSQAVKSLETVHMAGISQLQHAAGAIQRPSSADIGSELARPSGQSCSTSLHQQASTPALNSSLSGNAAAEDMDVDTVSLAGGAGPSSQAGGRSDATATAARHPDGGRLADDAQAVPGPGPASQQSSQFGDDDVAAGMVPALQQSGKAGDEMQEAAASRPYTQQSSPVGSNVLEEGTEQEEVSLVIDARTTGALMPPVWRNARLVTRLF